MKLGFKSLKKVKSPFAKRKREAAGDYMNPLRDWTIGLGIASVLFIVGIGFIFYDFKRQFSEGFELDAQESEIPRYSAGVVREFARVYTDRQTRFEQLRSVKATPTAEVVDTSTSTISVEKENAQSSSVSLPKPE